MQQTSQFPATAGQIEDTDRKFRKSASPTTKKKLKLAITKESGWAKTARERKKPAKQKRKSEHSSTHDDTALVGTSDSGTYDSISCKSDESMAEKGTESESASSSDSISSCSFSKQNVRKSSVASVLMSSDEDSLEEPALNKPNVRNITVFDPEQWIEQKLAPRQVDSKAGKLNQAAEVYAGILMSEKKGKKSHRKAPHQWR